MIKKVPLLMRLRAAWAAFRNKDWPVYAVIYDSDTVLDGQVTHTSEEYYGYFISEAQAEQMFNEAFPLPRFDHVHNAYVCRLGRNLRESKDL